MLHQHQCWCRLADDAIQNVHLKKKKERDKHDLCDKAKFVRWEKLKIDSNRSIIERTLEVNDSSQQVHGVQVIFI